MVRRFIYILLSLAVAVSAVSCLEEMEVAQPKPEGSDETILVPRVKSFTNQYITKAYANNETKITNLALLVFNNDGALVHLTETSNAAGVSSITLNKSLLNSPAQREKLNPATVVMIANVPLEKITRVKSGTTTETETLETAKPSLSEMEQFSINFEEEQTIVTDITSTGFTGFPMIGGKKGLNLNPTADQQSAIEVGLKILYAKINFSISVAEGTENNPYEGVTPSFTLNNYYVFNASMATTLAIPEEEGKPVRDFLGNVADESVVGTSDEATASSSYTYTTSGAPGTASGTTTLKGNNPVNFTFYVSESRYNHNSDLKGIYPDDNWLTSAEAEDVKDYNPDTDADKLNGVKYFYDDLIQQYKPKLATQSPDGAPAAGMATYVILDGSYTDYRSTVWDVEYKVYLGKDNAHNFHVDRNSEYTNLITIKGIRNRQDGAYGDGEVWIDHRINVSYNGTGADDHVTITRETLIDSHIEVRPLRVNWDNDKYAGVRVYLPTTSDGTTPVNWIGIERFTGNNNQEGAVYCYQNGKSTGKRKYFTNGLISELQSKGGELGVQTDNGKKFIYLLDGECAWIYFDGNTTTSERTADLKLAFYSAAGNVQTEEIYQIKQRGLQSIGGYTVESYEEYLHSYDSADKYNLSTSPVDYTQQGLSWGLTNKTISQDIIVSATSLDGIQNYVDQRYDYFHKSDIPPTETYYTYQLVDGSWANASYGTGLVFTDRASAKEGITIKDMGTLPENAYQYCLSKNKFNEDADGNHTLDIHWYLPDVYELKAVLAASKGSTTAADFGSDAYYWSSQPSFGGLSFNVPILDREISIKEEVVDNARAVSINDTKDIVRSNQNRIRCFYSATGLKANMADRTPDGIGGNYSFYMKAYKDKTKSSEAYFNFLMPELQRIENTTTDKYDYDDNSFPYPTFDNPGTYFGYFDNVVDADGNPVKGFGNNPLDQKYWSPHEDDASYFYALKDFPGLTANELEELEQWWTGQGAFRPTNTPKSDTQIVTTSDKLQLTRNLPGASLNTLDHLNGGDMINISFSNGNNESKVPYYVYLENDGSKVTTTRYWKVPTYASATYTPEPASNKETFTGEGTSKVNGIRGQYTEAQTQARNNADADALAAAKKAAEDKYPNRTYTYGSPKYTRTETYKSNTFFGKEYSRDYTCTTTCEIEITCTATATPVTYYQNASNGGWDDGTSNTEEQKGIETDQLVMYSGNSFTISLSDALDEKGVPYKDGYEITKVKVYYSGNNLVYKGGGFLGIGEDEVYTRFVDSEITLPPNPLEIPYGGSTETLQLPGMDYNEDATSGTGTHQWTGDGRQSVTLVLTDYFVNDQATSRKYTYQYTRTATYPNEYIIIDRIEVKCTPKSTTGQ